MGLLDALLSGSGGGLLDFLHNNGLNQQPMQGLPSDQAQYGQPMNAMAQMQTPIYAQNQPSSMDTAQWPVGPVGAPSQANAQAIPQQPPQVIQAQPQAPAQDSGPGIGDRLGMGFRGMAANMAGGPIGALMGGIAGIAGMGQGSSANMTAKALLAKGVDPTTVQAAISNPELMKTLITQNYGPQTVQALGNGYVADKNGKITRAYEPEDKIPAGFVKDDSGNMKYIPGGPADPAYIQLAEAKKKDPNGVYTLGRGGELYKIDAKGNPIIVHKNEADLGPGLTNDALDIQARQEAMGDFSGRKNMGRGAQSGKDIQEIKNRSTRVLMDEYGMTPAEAAAHMSKKYQEFNAQGIGLNAEARTTGVREANLNLILKAADAAIPAALEASDKVDRTGWVPLNKVIQHGQVIASNPELKKFGMANLQLAEHWARAMNPTGVMRESDRDKALEYLSTADSKTTYKEAVGQLRTQIERERDAVRSTRGMATMPGAAPETTPAPGSVPKPGAYVWSPDKGIAPK
jgi:hypothetical protein